MTTETPNGTIPRNYSTPGQSVACQWAMLSQEQQSALALQIDCEITEVRRTEDLRAAAYFMRRYNLQAPFVNDSAICLEVIEKISAGKPNSFRNGMGNRE